MDEFTQAIATALGLSDDADSDAIIAAASALTAEVTPLREAAAAASEKQTFADRFPQEFSRMTALEKSDRENKAKAFADRYSNKRLVEGEGEEAKTTGMGFSALTIENIEKLHLAFSEGAMTQTHVEDVLESLLNTGLVDYSESGSKTEDDTTPVTGEASAKAFADKVASIQTEDKVDQSAAVRIAAERHPELFKAYRETYSFRQ